MGTGPSPAGNPDGLEPLVDVGALAACGRPVSTVNDWRSCDLAQRAYRLGRNLRFALSDVRIWIEQQRGPELPPPADGGDEPAASDHGNLAEIGHLVSSDGRLVARARYRDWDGKRGDRACDRRGS